MKKNQHVVPHNGNWEVRSAGNERVTRQTRTQAEAINVARGITINQGSEMLIHRQDGRIRERNTYGEDPNPQRG